MIGDEITYHGYGFMTKERKHVHLSLNKMRTLRLVVPNLQHWELPVIEQAKQRISSYKVDVMFFNDCQFLFAGVSFIATVTSHLHIGSISRYPAYL